MCDKVFKNGSIKVCGRQPLKILKHMVCLSRPYRFKVFKNCLPQILLGPFLNTLSHIFNKKIPQNICLCEASENPSLFGKWLRQSCKSKDIPMDLYFTVEHYSYDLDLNDYVSF